MPEFENKIEIERPVEDVFGFVADLTNIPEWNYYVASVVPTSPRGATAGATYHQVRQSDEQDLRIKALEPNRAVIVEMIPPSQPQLHRETRFQPRGSGTLLTGGWQLGLGVPRLLEPVAAARVRSSVRQNLEKLKLLLESGTVVLQDGRTFRR